MGLVSKVPLFYQWYFGEGTNDYMNKSIAFLVCSIALSLSARSSITELDSALKYHDYVFRGMVMNVTPKIDTLFGNLIFPVLRIRFLVDTLYKGTHNDTFTVDYMTDTAFCGNLPASFKKNRKFEIGVDKVPYGKLTPFITSRKMLEPHPYEVKPNRYPIISCGTYIKEL